MNKLLKKVITLTAIGVAVKEIKDKESKSIYIHAVNQSDAIEGMKQFLIKEKKQYLTHEYDFKNQKVFLLFK